MLTTIHLRLFKNNKRSRNQPETFKSHMYYRKVFVIIYILNLLATYNDVVDGDVDEFNKESNKAHN